MGRRMLTFADRADIAVGIEAGLSDTQIAHKVGRHRSVVSRERRRNSTKTRGYRPVHAHRTAARRRKRPQQSKIDTDPVLAARVRADLARSRTPRQIAGRLHAEAADPTMSTTKGSPDAGGRRVSHEGIYRWIYTLPKNELDRVGVMLRSKRTRRKPRRHVGERTKAPIVDMTSIDKRPHTAADRRVPGAWEGDLIIGRAGGSAAATLVERTSRFVVLRGLPLGKNADGLAEILIDTISGLPKHLRGSLTWDQGTEMARHSAVTRATRMPVYFAHPHSPWERPSNENTNGLIREYLPKGARITAHQPYLDMIAAELNDRPRAVLGYHTPQEVFTKLLVEATIGTPDATSTVEGHRKEHHSSW